MQFGREQLSDSDRVRIYHTRTRLGPKRLPALLGSVQEIAGLCVLRAQQELHAGVAEMGRLSAILTEISTPEDATTPEHPLVGLVRDLEGVEFVQAWGYSCVVVRGKMFGWEELEPGILRAFGTFARPLPMGGPSAESGGING